MKYKELPKWIQKYLSDMAASEKTIFCGNIYYDEDCVIDLVEILIKNYSTKTDEDIKNEMLKLMCKDDYDPEPDHMKADELLCTLLQKLGYNEIVDIYQNVEKWYV